MSKAILRLLREILFLVAAVLTIFSYIGLHYQILIAGLSGAIAIAFTYIILFMPSTYLIVTPLLVFIGVPVVFILFDLSVTLGTILGNIIDRGASKRELEKLREFTADSAALFLVFLLMLLSLVGLGILAVGTYYLYRLTYIVLGVHHVLSGILLIAVYGVVLKFIFPPLRSTISASTSTSYVSRFAKVALQPLRVAVYFSFFVLLLVVFVTAGRGPPQ